MHKNPLDQLSRQFLQYAEASLRAGLQIEVECLAQLNIEGEIAPGRYQAAMVNFCCAIEGAAKCIVAKDCPPAIFSLTGKRTLDHETLRDLWNPALSETDLMRAILNKHVLSFEATLRVANETQPLLNLPVDQDILSAARNQAIHSLVLDEGRQVDLVAVTAIYLLDFIESQNIEQLNCALKLEEKQRLKTFQEERRAAAESAHKALHKVLSARLLRKDPLKYDQDVDTDDRVHVRCPLCQVRARIEVDQNRTWLEPGSIVLFNPGTTKIQFVYPKHFSCPGCTLELYDRAIAESGRVFAPMPLPG